MSFGFSAGDFVICIQLAHKVRRECRNAPENIWTVSTEVASLRLVLKEMQEAVNDHEPNESKKSDLSKLIEGCNDVLQELHGLLNKYNSLGTQSRRTWDRMRWSQEQIESIGQRVIPDTGLLTLFHVGLIGAGQARIERLQMQLILEHQSGLRESSVISVDSLQSAEEGDEDGWSQIARELEDVGITSTMANGNRSSITAWIKEALKNRSLSECVHSPSSDHNQSAQILPGNERCASVQSAHVEYHEIQHGMTNPRSTQGGIRPPSLYGIWPSDERPARAYASCVCTYPNCTDDPRTREPYSGPTPFDLLSHLRNIHGGEDHSFSKYLPGVYGLHGHQYMTTYPLEGTCPSA